MYVYSQVMNWVNSSRRPSLSTRRAITSTMPSQIAQAAIQLARARATDTQPGVILSEVVIVCITGLSVNVVILVIIRWRLPGWGWSRRCKACVRSN